MAYKTDLKAGVTVFSELGPRFWRGIKTNAAVTPNQLLDMDTNGAVGPAVVNSGTVVGVCPGGTTLATGKSFQRSGISFGPCVFKADGILTAGQFVKAAAAGRVSQWVSSTLSGTTIKATTAGGNAANQPSNDIVQVVSASAGDTTQTVTLIGTTTAVNTVVVETIALNGTTAVDSVKTDWGIILAVKLSASCAGTVTVRVKTGPATITTLTTGVLSKGVNTVSSSGTTQYAYNAIPTAVASGASTKQLGLQGTNSAGTTIYDSKALNGTTAVTFNTAFKTVTEVYDLDLATATTATVSVGAADGGHLRVGRTFESATAQDQLVNGFLNPG
jgi:hypothetical protein